MIGDRIKALRKDKKLSQAAFGEVLGVSRDAINNAENNRANVSELMIRAIVSNFNVNEEWLRNGIGEMFRQTNLTDEETRDEAIARRVEEMVLKDDSFRQKLILALLRIPSDKWDLIEQAAREILAENEESRDG